MQDDFSDIAEPVDDFADIAEPISAVPVAQKQSKLKLPSIFGVSKAGRVAQGAFDPSIAAAQLVGKGLSAAGIPYGDRINEFYSETGRGYEQERAGAGQSGIDVARIVGNIASPTTAIIAGAAPAKTASTAAKIGYGAGTGAAFGALTPAGPESESFLADKATQIGAGAAIGAAIPVAGNMLSSVLKPKAVTDKATQEIIGSGVKPTIGQAMGGWANDIEQKLTSFPVVGKTIADKRWNAVKDFNKSSINQALEPIGGSVNSHGFDALKQASKANSDFYNSAKGMVKSVQLDDQFASDFSQLKGLFSNLSNEQQARINKIVDNEIVRKVSPNGSMMPETWKQIDSNLGNIAKKASDKEVADGVLQLNQLLKDAAKRQNPEFADAMQKADLSYAMLARISDAAKKAGEDGIFTPAQLLTAVKQNDSGGVLRGASVGDALMQDWANSGKKVLGNTVADSGTAGRTAASLGAMGLGGASIGAGAASSVLAPAIASGVALRGVYTKPVQNALVKLATERPKVFSQLANQSENILLPRTANALISARNQ
jgi:hypothetical protein